MHKAEAELGADGEVRRLHYLSVPPKAALDVVHQLDEAGLVERSRIIMEKPFGTDLESRGGAQRPSCTRSSPRSQIFRIDHFLGKEAAQNILAFRFANGLFEPIWNRNFIDHVQIDVPETLGLEGRTEFYEATGAYRDMVVTHLMQVLAFMAMEPPTSLAPGPISDEKLKVFRSMKPIEPHDVVRGQYTGYRQDAGGRRVLRHRDLRGAQDRDRQLALGRRAVLPAHRQEAGRGRADHLDRVQGAAAVDVPEGSNAGMQGPDHLTFDLADQSRMSLSFYGKRPGPGMQLEKLSMQFATHETDELRRRTGGLRAADPGRHARRPHALHDRRRHRDAVGEVGPADPEPAAGPRLRARLAGDPTRSTS